MRDIATINIMVVVGYVFVKNGLGFIFTGVGAFFVLREISRLSEMSKASSWGAGR